MSQTKPPPPALTLAPAMTTGFVVLMQGPDGSNMVRFAHQEPEACLEHMREAFCAPVTEEKPPRVRGNDGATS